MKRLLILILLAGIGGCGKNDQDGHIDLHGEDGHNAHAEHSGQTHETPNGAADPNSTIAAYTEAIRINPDDPEAYFKRGDAYGANGEYDKAVADFTEVIRLDPNHPEASFRRSFASRLKDAQAKAAAEQKATPKKSVESRETLTLKGHSGRVASVSFSPDGKRIVTGGDDTVKVWDISSMNKQDDGRGSQPI